MTLKETLASKRLLIGQGDQQRLPPTSPSVEIEPIMNPWSRLLR